MNKSIFIKISVFIVFLAMVVVNALANILPINNISTGEISDAYPNLFAPAGLTFSIWGLIYLLLFGYTIYQFINKKKSKLLGKIGVYFIVSSLANIFWIFSWHYQIIEATLFFMAVILFCLIKVAGLLRKEKFSSTENLFIRLPFSVYFGWITVAMIANITVFLVSIGWDGFGVSENIWTIIVISVGSIIGIWRMNYDKNISYGLVFVWALIGIWIKHSSAVGFAGQYPEIITTVFIWIFLFLIFQFLLLRKTTIKKLIKK